MKTTVRFDHVCKQYRLGLSQTSLLKSLSNLLKGGLQRGSQTLPSEQVLWALRDVSFELSPGQTLGLIGSNGAGKTTMLKLLANITRPTSGHVEINGRVSALIELGAGFHPDLTGRENIYLNGTILGLSRKEIKRRFDEIVAFSEIDRFIDTPVKRYSSGMIVRLGFAVASCIEPDVLLVDEVLAVGDASFRQKCMKRIQSLRHNGTSIIFVSHNLYLVQAVCTSAIYMERGQIKYQGETSEVIDVYERDVHEKRAQKLAQSQSEPTRSSSEIEIRKVEILATENLPTLDFSSDQPAEVRVHYMAYQEVQRANFVIRIIRSDGLTCCMMRTSLDNVHLSLQRGPGIVSVTLEPLQLVGSTYFVEARVTNASDSIALTTGRSKWFYVKGSALSYQEASGVFEPRKKWNHYPVSQASALIDAVQPEFSLNLG